jgi:hypothetical protein
MSKALVGFFLLFLHVNVFAQSRELRCDCDDFTTTEDQSFQQNLDDLQAVADHVLGPTNLPPFQLDQENGDAVFIDITHSSYNLEVSNDPKQIIVTAVIDFKTLSPGFPLLDLLPNADQVEIDEAKAELKETPLPCHSSSMKYVNHPLQAGDHKLKLKYILKYPFLDPNGKPIDEKSKDEDIFFKLSDLSDRGYLERYLPTNLNSDQYSFEVNIKFLQDRGDIFVMSNGEVGDDTPEGIKIKFPEKSNASSMMLHLAHQNDFIVQESTYSSVQKSGEIKPIKLIVYMSKKDLEAEMADTNKPTKSTPDEFMNQAKESLLKAETLFGPAHGNKFIVKAKPAQNGGMEYAMAAETGLGAIDHEILHSYFGRGIQSKDGNSQWLDEAVAVWLEEYVHGERNISGNDKNEQLLKAGAPFLISSNLGARSAFHRNSERNAYRYGANFMSYLDWKISHSDPQKGLYQVLARLVNERMDKTWDNNIFLKAIKDETGLDVQDEFDFFVKGRNLDQLKNQQALVENVRLFEREQPHKKVPKVKEGETSSIHFAASGNSLETFNAIYKASPQDLTKVDTYGRSVLSYAMAGRNIEIVKRIVDLGFPVNPEETKNFVNTFPQWELEFRKKLCQTFLYEWTGKSCK